MANRKNSSPFSQRPLRLSKSDRAPDIDTAQSVSYRAGQNIIADMSEHLDSRVYTTPIHSLEDKQWLQLALKRIRQRKEPAFELLVPGKGRISKTRALQEIQKGTALGQTILIMEQSQVRAEVERAQATQSKLKPSAPKKTSGKGRAKKLER
jgi:hypothetical protein